jgi:hypothetical protein
MCGFHFRREEEGLRREEQGQVATSCPRCSALVNLA